MARMSWVKLWVAECLTGTIRWELEPDERGVWYDLLLLAGDCRTAGIISANETTPLPRRTIAGRLNIDDELLDRTIKKCVASGRIEIDKKGLIHICSWAKYQSEYQRQKKYRQKTED